MRDTVTSRIARTRRRHAGILALGLLAAAAGCENAVEPGLDLPPLQPAALDADAGQWRMVVLSGPGQIAVPAPAPVGSAAYQAELQAVRRAQANITPAQRQAIDFWSGGGVLRWNEAMRELVARYNLPPAPRPDGSYPAPDPENPFGDPAFPFASPPYAARAYSYVSVAQFEALKAAWHYKFQYGRPAPARVDDGIQALAPVGDLPAYPSEDAVLAGVTAEMLKLLFPGSVEHISRLAAQHREAALLSGKATASDVAAGLALGRAVAAAVIARARTDGMGNAVGTPTQWQALHDNTVARGEIPWVSLEFPRRPPMLPNFGDVAAWTMTREEVIAAQPPPPPSTSSEQMRREVAEVRHIVDNLTREQIAIAHFWNDGAGTPTPPGHWNLIASRFVRDARMSEVRAARTFAMLNMAMHDAAVGCWAVKFRDFNPRPSQLDPGIRTVTGVPNFPAYPSGHSTFSAAAAEVLSYVFPHANAELDRMKDEAGMSRMYGGIHYRSDVEHGKAHGVRVGEFVVRFARADGAN